MKSLLAWQESVAVNVAFVVHNLFYRAILVASWFFSTSFQMEFMKEVSV